MKRVIPLLLLLAIGGAVVYFHPQWFRKPIDENVLKLSGNIEAHESLVSFKVTGRIIDLPVDEGMTLKAGDLLARLDNDDYRQQVAVDESAIGVRNRQLTLGLAGSRTQDIEAAKLAMLDAQADLEQKKKDYARYQALYEKDEIPGQTRDLAATNVTRAQATYDRAQQIYNELVEGTRKEELAVDRANVHQADQNLHMSRIRLAYTVLRAPFTGVVLVRQAELGEVVSPGTPDRDPRRPGPSVGAGVRAGDGSRQSALGAGGRCADRYLPGQNLSWPDFFHLFGGGIHPQERADGERARHAGLPGQSGCGESEPGAEARNAGRRSDQAEVDVHTMSIPPAIIVSSLSKHFGEVRAVDGLSFEVYAGEIFGLVGPDGAGKTTTMRMLAGVLSADSGSAQVAGCDVVRDPEARQIPTQLHVAAIWSLRRFDGGRKHPVLCGFIWSGPQAARAALPGIAGGRGLERFPQPPGREIFPAG